MVTGATGSATAATAATPTGAGDRLSPAFCEENRQLARGALTKAIFARNRCVGVFHGSNCFKMCATILALIFVDGHLISPTNRITSF